MQPWPLSVRDVSKLKSRFPERAPSRSVSASPPPCTWWRCKWRGAGSQRNRPWTPRGRRGPRAGCRAARPGRWVRRPGRGEFESWTSRRGHPRRTSPWRHGEAGWAHPAACPLTDKTGERKYSVKVCSKFPAAYDARHKPLPHLHSAVDFTHTSQYFTFKRDIY